MVPMQHWHAPASLQDTVPTAQRLQELATHVPPSNDDPELLDRLGVTQVPPWHP
jgi:hypothetical protein